MHRSTVWMIKKKKKSRTKTQFWIVPQTGNTVHLRNWINCGQYFPNFCGLTQQAAEHHATVCSLSPPEPFTDQWQPALTNSLQFYHFFTWCHMVWNILLTSLCQLPWLHPLLAPHVPLAHRTVWESEKSLAAPFTTTKMLVCYQNCFSSKAKA